MTTSTRLPLPFLGALLLAACGTEAGPSAEPSSIEAAATVEARDIAAGALEGTWLDAGDDAPVVLIVPGSGPTDRDGNNPGGVRTSSYAKLAEGLGARGISSVRVDKRGMFGSEGAGDPNAVTVDLYAADYRSWVAAIREETGAECVHLLGHSEGGLMVSAAAQEADGVCSVILLAAPGRPMGDILREQLRANPANRPVLGDAFAFIDGLEAGRRVDATNAHPALQGLFAAPVQDFLISVMAVDPAELAGSLEVPVLVVQGDTDIQVSVADAQRLSDASGGTLAILPGVNHVLVEAPENRLLNMATYARAKAPISPLVVDAIAPFVRDPDGAP